jgi:hypothetical protein
MRAIFHGRYYQADTQGLPPQDKAYAQYALHLDERAELREFMRQSEIEEAKKAGASKPRLYGAARREAEEAEMKACVRIIDSRDSTQDEKREAMRKIVAQGERDEREARFIARRDAREDPVQRQQRHDEIADEIRRAPERAEMRRIMAQERRVEQNKEADRRHKAKKRAERLAGP